MISSFYAINRIKLRRIGMILSILALFLLVALEVLSFTAATLFNHAIKQQDMLRGTIRVERLISDITGHVYFTNLEWYDQNGERILSIPSGDFRVRLWDVITHHYKSTTIQELNVYNANISLHFDEAMRLDFIRPSPDMEKMQEEDWQKKVSLEGLSEEKRRAIGEARRRMQQNKMTRRWQNFNATGKKIKLKLNVHDSRFEILAHHRHYLMNHVQLMSSIDTTKKMVLAMTIGGFGGIMVGDGITLNGHVDFHGEDVPTADLSAVFYAVDPSSLGFGMNLHDKMTLDAYFSGPLTHPLGTGSLSMDELNIPGLFFTNVRGDISYDNAMLNFTNVSANVFDGILTAYGDYNLDTRYYHIYGTGSDLSAAKALPGSGLSCRVAMDLMVASDGSSKGTLTSGSFQSSAGRYHMLPFERITGTFHNAYRDLRFYDVRLSFAGFNVATDGLRIENGRLALSPIHITDKDGSPLYTYVHEKGNTP